VTHHHDPLGWLWLALSIVVAVLYALLCWVVILRNRNK
jgi:hypothetical protein